MSELLTREETAERLLKVDNILIIAHKSPDGDTLGSSAALHHAFTSLGKTSAILCADPIPERYAYLNIALYENSFEPEYVIAVDLAGPQLFGEATYKYAKNCDLCIDHHGSNTHYAKALLLDDTAAACAEVMHDLLCELNIEITPLIANCLYTGVSTDTGCFRFANTTAHTHAIAAKLMEQGADIITLNHLLFESKSKSTLEMEKEVLSTLEYYFDEQCALIYITQGMIERTGVESTDLESISGIPRAIEGVKVGVTMRQQPSGSYKISVRSVTGYNASDICARLGGGGHAQAAGCEVIGNLDNAKAAILAEVEKEL